MRAAPALLLLLLAAAGCGRAPGDGFVPLFVQPVDLHEGDAAVRGTGVLAWRGGLHVASSDPRFGGYSGLAVEGGGTRLMAVSDRGHVLEARLHYDADGMLAGLTEAVIGDIAGPDGRPVAGTRLHDAEALARAGGDLIVGFEGPARLWRYPGGELSAPPRVLAPPPGADRLPANEGFEAVAALADGRLLVLAEAPPLPDRPAAWIGTPGNWRVVEYVRTGRFVPVGAAALADGGAVVLERRFTWVGAFATRIVHLSAARLRAGGRLEGEELARIEAPLIADNFEGIAVHETPGGETLLYLVSDDNFFPLQRTLLLMFAWRRGLQ